MIKTISKRKFERMDLLCVGACGLVLALGVLTTGYMMAATFFYFLLLAGWIYQKRSTRVHGLLMGAGVAGDVALVFVLEVQRHAVGTVAGFGMTFVQQAHVYFSFLAVLLYFPLLATGVAGHLRPELRPRFRGFHRTAGPLAVIFRTAGFLLMFSMLGRPPGN